MKSIRSYPGVLTLLLVAVALFVNGLVDYINYEVASPSFLGALGCVVSVFALIAVYEVKAFKQARKPKSLKA